MASPENPPEIVARAAEAFAKELHWGQRQRELSSLVGALDQPVATSPQWTKSFTQGLHAGSGQTSLSAWMKHVSRESQVRSRRSRVWIYPLVMFSLAIAVLLFLSPMVLTPFEKMFGEFGLALPGVTSFVLSVNRYIFAAPLDLLVYGSLAVAIAYGIGRIVRRYSLLSRYCNWLVAGNSQSVSAMASFTGMLAHLLRAGISLPDAVEESGLACGHNHLANAGRQLAQHLRDGRGPLAKADAAFNFPRNVIDAIEPNRGGTPNLALLCDLSTLYEERVTTRTEWANGAASVLGVLVVGMIVGFVAIALFAPLIELISALT